jgi:type II secretory pathway component PulK
MKKRVLVSVVVVLACLAPVAVLAAGGMTYQQQQYNLNQAQQALDRAQAYQEAGKAINEAIQKVGDEYLKQQQREEERRQQREDEENSRREANNDSE